MSSSDLSDFKYDLKATFLAHQGDVRAVTAAIKSVGGVITGSRDTTVKIWVPDEKNKYRETQVFQAGIKFISSLCTLPPSEQYPDGMVLAGSNDSFIYGFCVNSHEPIMKLSGHSDCVCSLSSGRLGIFVSGSWDMTARVWYGQKCKYILCGHLQSVWATAVFPAQNLVLTGSADRTIRLWNSGTCERIFEGHEDCVRGLAIKSSSEFLSCSNDYTVRLWKISGECMSVAESHTHYIYSIITLNDGHFDFATCGEDQTVKIWKDNHCKQSITFASQSLWSIACLTNGDLAIGGSDGVVYILEKVSVEKYNECPKFVMQLPTLEVSSEGGVETQAENIPNSSLSAKDLCRVPGKYDGETVICFEEVSQQMHIYEWIDAGGKWIKQSGVKPVGGSSTNLTISKALTDHQERKLTKVADYEIHVVFESQRLTIYYNKGDDIEQLADDFVKTHNISPHYIPAIIQHIKSTTSVPNSQMPSDDNYFPAEKYLVYNTVNVNGLRQKLHEFSAVLPPSQQIPPERIEDVALVATVPIEVSDDQMATLDALTSWDDGFLFPVLDLLRMAVTCKAVIPKVIAPGFVNHLLHILMQTNVNLNKRLVMKIFCNFFGYAEGQKVVAEFSDKIWDSVHSAISSSDLSVQKAATALFFNYAVIIAQEASEIDIRLDLFCEYLFKVLSILVDQEAVYRHLMAVGTLCFHNDLATAYFTSLNILPLLYEIRNTTTCAKVMKVLGFLFTLFEK